MFGAADISGFCHTSIYYICPSNPPLLVLSWCSAILQHDFEPAVVEQQGFAFRNERPNATAVQGEK